MIRIYAPLPEHLPVAPELATLSALDAALNATTDVLDLQHDLGQSNETDAQLAEEIMRQARVLRALIHLYARVVLGDDDE